MWLYSKENESETVKVLYDDNDEHDINIRKYVYLYLT